MGTRRRDAVADVRRKGAGPSRSRRSLRIMVEFDEQPMEVSLLVTTGSSPAIRAWNVAAPST